MTIRTESRPVIPCPLDDMVPLKTLTEGLRAAARTAVFMRGQPTTGDPLPFTLTEDDVGRFVEFIMRARRVLPSEIRSWFMVGWCTRHMHNFDVYPRAELNRDVIIGNYGTGGAAFPSRTQTLVAVELVNRSLKRTLARGADIDEPSQIREERMMLRDTLVAAGWQPRKALDGRRPKPERASTWIPPMDIIRDVGAEIDGGW